MNDTLVETSLEIEVIPLKKTALVLRAINHKLRQHILRLIHENGRMIVTDLYVKLRVEQSVASQHLAILRKAGFVTTKRKGKFIFYSIDYNRMAEVHRFSKSIINSDK